MLFSTLCSNERMHCFEWLLVYSVQLKELQNYDRKLFFVCHKISLKPNQHSKLLFLKINIDFDTSDWSSTYGKLNFYPITRIFFVFFSLEMQRKLLQTKVYYKLCYSVWKETSHKLLTVSTAKKVFPKSVYHWYNLLRWLLFIPYHSFVWQVCCSLVKLSCCCFLWNKWFERISHIKSIISTTRLQCC